MNNRIIYHIKSISGINIIRHKYSYTKCGKCEIIVTSTRKGSILKVEVLSSNNKWQLVSNNFLSNFTIK